MFKQSVILFYVAVLLSGCASGLSVMNPPTIEDNGEYGTITVERSHNQFRTIAMYYVNLDGQLIAGLGLNEYTSFRVKPGEHIVTVHCYDLIVNSWLMKIFMLGVGHFLGDFPLNTGATIQLNVEHAQNYYIFAKPADNSRCVVANVTETKTLKGQKFIKPGTVSDKHL